MSAAAAAPTIDAGAAVPAKKGKKKLIIILAVAVLLLVVLGGGAVVFLKKRAAAAAAAADESAQPSEHKPSKPDLKHPPTFLPLDPFVVNLADKDADRYAQIGITLELEDPAFAEQMKAFMPSIRNAILLILSQKSSRDLLDIAGKEQLAAQIRREAARTMGIDVAEPPAAAGSPADAASAAKVTEGDDPGAKPKPRQAHAPAERNPIRRVNFSNFIIQ
ncbi:MAG: flagellar basal body-associated FliL family protein [Burkholderiales bacterium]|nr:flagellar basal body-associated FliL family protein [Burkholderiales bacterium]MDE2628391.1 flagellar basal body-associated FliL family protein [Burkholderiales bacterium]